MSTKSLFVLSAQNLMRFHTFKKGALRSNNKTTRIQCGLEIIPYKEQLEDIIDSSEITAVTNNILYKNQNNETVSYVWCQYKKSLYPLHMSCPMCKICLLFKYSVRCLFNLAWFRSCVNVV